MLKAAAVSAAPSLQTGEQRVLFKAPPLPQKLAWWEPQADGKRFLFLVPQGQDVSAFNVVLNWPATLKR